LTHSIDATAGVQVRVFTDLHRLDMDSRSWNDLVLRSETNSVFQTYEWITSWWKVFGAQRKLLVIAVYRDDRMVGLAPLMEEPALVGAPAIKFIGNGNADYCDFILTEPREPALRAIIGYLAGRRTEWCSICLNNVPQQSSTVEWLKSLCAEQQLPLLVRSPVECPTLIFEQQENTAAAVLRKDSLKRPYNYFLSHGEVQFTECTTLDQARTLMPQFFEQHIGRWHGTSSPSLFTNPRNREFYSTLLEHMLPTGRLVFSVVHFNKQPIAFHYGFDYGGRFLWYKPSFDASYRKHSPGNLLLRFLLQRAIEHGCSEFDFTIGNEEFKRRYSNAVRRNLSLQIFPNRPRFYLSGGLLRCIQLVKQAAFWRS
jgi:CelD/BcsL family acetyltransferase involved in cellulose biosynthesis